MSSGPARRVSPKDIQMVQNLIERCLQLYMNRREVVEMLLAQAKIEPGFTELVWQKLEEENQDFFKAYNLRLMVKSQIMQFNKLLEQQVHLMQQMNNTIPVPSSNGNHLSLHRNPPRYGPETMVGNVGTRLYSNNGNDPSVHNLSGSVDISVHSNRNNLPAEMIPSQSSNMCMMRSGMVKSETEYSGTSPFLLPGNGSVLEPRVDGSVQSFSSVDSCAHVLHDTLLDPEIAFAQLSQFPRNFSLSDLTADFAQSSDILESYSGSPFLLNENETFMDSRGRKNQGEAKRLDTISEGMNYDDFGSE